MNNTNQNTNQNINKNANKNQNELGALWKKKSKSGMSFLSGYVKVDDLGLEKEIKVVVFANNNKSKDNAPDYRIYVSKPLENQNKSTPSNTVDNTSSDTVAKAVPVKKVQPVVEEDQDDIL